jgi:hypothetical protein
MPNSTEATGMKSVLSLEIPSFLCHFNHLAGAKIVKRIRLTASSKAFFKTAAQK